MMAKSKRQELLANVKMVATGSLIGAALGAIIALLLGYRLMRPKTVVNSR